MNERRNYVVSVSDLSPSLSKTPVIEIYVLRRRHELRSSRETLIRQEVDILDLAQKLQPRLLEIFDYSSFSGCEFSENKTNDDARNVSFATLGVHMFSRSMFPLSIWMFSRLQRNKGL